MDRRSGLPDRCRDRDRGRDLVQSGCDPKFTVKADLDRKERDAKVKEVPSRLKQRDRRRKRKP
jgi:hypothetical protein